MPVVRNTRICDPMHAGMCILSDGYHRAYMHEQLTAIPRLFAFRPPPAFFLAWLVGGWLVGGGEWALGELGVVRNQQLIAFLPSAPRATHSVQPWTTMVVGRWGVTGGYEANGA